MKTFPIFGGEDILFMEKKDKIRLGYSIRLTDHYNSKGRRRKICPRIFRDIPEFLTNQNFFVSDFNPRSYIIILRYFWENVTELHSRHKESMI